MPVSTMTSREFNQHVSRAKRAAKDGPVIITERGKPSYVLMRHDAFIAEPTQRVKPKSLAEALADPGALDFDFDPPKSLLSTKVPDFG
ncbi:MAG: type II toxin-antitoxin system Phd/YefM family antitoxin [Beijerinckiaceae bacterium]